MRLQSDGQRFRRVPGMRYRMRGKCEAGMKRRIIAIALGVAVAWPVMFVVGIAGELVGNLAGTGVGMAVCAWWLLRRGRTPPASQIARGTE